MLNGTSQDHTPGCLLKQGLLWSADVYWLSWPVHGKYLCVPNSSVCHLAWNILKLPPTSFMFLRLCPFSNKRVLQQIPTRPTTSCYITQDTHKYMLLYKAEHTQLAWNKDRQTERQTARQFVAVRWHAGAAHVQRGGRTEWLVAGHLTHQAWPYLAALQ